MVEYAIIRFPERRIVLIGGTEQGYNMNEASQEEIKEIGTGKHTFSLQGPADFEPLEREVIVKDTTLISPLIIEFSKPSLNSDATSVDDIGGDGSPTS